MHARVSVPAHFVSSMTMHGMQDLGDGNIKMTEKREDSRLKEGEGTE